MRKKRKHRHDSDSFDMFLDIITNTFGGVLLIALLMVLLIRETNHSKVEQVVQQENPVDLEEEIAVLNARKESLAQSLAVRSAIASKFDDPESKKLAEKIEGVVHTEQQLLEQRSDAETRGTNITAELNQFQANRKKTKVETEKLKNQFEDLQRQLAEEQNLRMRTMSLPKEKATYKSLTVALIKNNQLFFLDKNRGSGRFELNSQHFENSSKGAADVILMDGTSVKTVDGKGLRIESADLKRAFSKFDKDSYIAMAVWKDSFATFSTVKNACVTAGFEYRLVLIEEGPVVETRSSTGAKAQ